MEEFMNTIQYHQSAKLYLKYFINTNVLTRLAISASALLSKGVTNGDRPLNEAAIVSVGSTHRKIAPKRINFPIRTSTGNLNKNKELVFYGIKIRRCQKKKKKQKKF